MGEPRFLARAAVAAAAVLVMGCGSGSGSGDDTPSKADYVKQANKICTDGTTELVEAGQGIDINDSENYDKAVRDIFVPSVRQQIETIRELGYPEGDQKELDAVYTKVERALDEIEKDPARYRTAEGNPFVNENKFLRSYGLDSCASQG